MSPGRRWLAFCLLAALFMPACQTFDHPAERVVFDMYEALNEGDTNAYMDAIHPENRKQPNLFGLVSAFSIGVGPVRADLGKLTQISFRDIKVSVVQEVWEQYVIVQAEGYVRYPLLMMEIPFCDQHDVRLYSDGNWYVDIYAPEKIVRLQELIQLSNQESLLEPSRDLESIESILYAEFLEGLETGVNLCLPQLP